jgi:hypothetical protein
MATSLALAGTAAEDGHLPAGPSPRYPQIALIR